MSKYFKKAIMSLFNKVHGATFVLMISTIFSFPYFN